MAPDPQTPKKARRTRPEAEQAVKEFKSNLSIKWNLDLDVDVKGQDFEQTVEERCVRIIWSLCWRTLDGATWDTFNKQAIDIHKDWSTRPHISAIEDDQKSRTLSTPQRTELLDCLYRVLKEESEKAHVTPSSRHSTTILEKDIDDRPVQFSLPDSKRIREDFCSAPSKKVKPSTSSNIPFPQTKFSGEPIVSSSGIKGNSVAANRSANTSFTSVGSIFDIPTSLNSTQVSSLDGANDEESIPRPQQMSQLNNTQDSYDGSILTYDVMAKLSPGMESGLKKTVATEISEVLMTKLFDRKNDDLENPVQKVHVEPEEERLKTRLQGVFPQMPPSLRAAPWILIYELTRICLHSGVSIAEIKLPIAPKFYEWDAFWGFVKDNIAFKDKSLPERSSKEAWESGLGGIGKGFTGIVLSGSLQFNDAAAAEAPFKFRLHPIKLDLTHRLGRGLGCDRFLEIEIPLLTGYDLPKEFARLGKRYVEIVVDWLVDSTHDLFGRGWKPFFTEKLKKKKERDPTRFTEIGNRVCFFAVRGNGIAAFKEERAFSDRERGRYEMSIDNLLNFIRPTRKNTDQSFLKLFSRITLALSRNWATVVLERSQILDCDDIPCESDPTHKMTDGAGRISPSLAQKISQRLGLSYLPSGFQGRIGEAKGFWTINYADQSGLDWIKTYESQCKWKRSTKKGGESDDETQRTFEVVGYSGPLKSKALNQQILPILMDRARDKKAMKHSLEKFVKEGLAREVKALHSAMESPQTLRKWLYEFKSCDTERLKAGQVPYIACLPHAFEEKLNLLLDGGFHPTQQIFVKILVKKMFQLRCDDIIKKLKITVDKSASVYMVPDFDGVLEPDEVYIDISSFRDESAGLSTVDLFGKEILVTRSPAHLLSDIQKVKVVPKVELMRLKDVIVFSTKGSMSLAAKLSGGDYDGDRAWVCWEPTIVDNFQNHEVPKLQDLVDLGYIHKDSRTYAQVVEGSNDKSSSFLKQAFIFNMQKDLLGECTNHKDAVCWTQKSVGTPEALWLSTLLSSLVDQGKQGLTFTDEDWARFKNDLIKVKANKPSYKKKGPEGFDPKSSHIIDHLKCLIYDTIQDCLTNFHKGITTAVHWDNDLAKQYEWASQKAKTNENWRTLIAELDADLLPVQSEWNDYWAKHAPKNSWDESKGESPIIVRKCYEMFLEIRPHADNPFTQALLPDCGDPEQSEWALLRASALFHKYKECSPLPWWMGGVQLVKLKARHGGFTLPHTVVRSMYASLKPDGSYINRYKSRNEGTVPEEDVGMNLEDEEGVEEGVEDD